jgi:hypothetical protein
LPLGGAHCRAPVSPYQSLNPAGASPPPFADALWPLTASVLFTLPLARLTLLHPDPPALLATHPHRWELLRRYGLFRVDADTDPVSGPHALSAPIRVIHPDDVWAALPAPLTLAVTLDLGLGGGETCVFTRPEFLFAAAAKGCASVIMTHPVLGPGGAMVGLATSTVTGQGQSQGQGGGACGMHSEDVVFVPPATVRDSKGDDGFSLWGGSTEGRPCLPSLSVWILIAPRCISLEGICHAWTHEGP